MKRIIINRFKVTSNYSLGEAFLELECCKTLNLGKSLERGWRDNERGVSCISEGTYEVRLEWSPRFNKYLWEIYGVPDRSECKLHAANFWRELNGCIALGNSHVDIDGDGDKDVTSSRNTMKKFHKLMGDDTKALIVIKNV